MIQKANTLFYIFIWLLTYIACQPISTDKTTLDTSSSASTVKDKDEKDTICQSRAITYFESELAQKVELFMFRENTYQQMGYYQYYYGGKRDTQLLKLEKYVASRHGGNGQANLEETTHFVYNSQDLLQEVYYLNTANDTSRKSRYYYKDQQLLKVKGEMIIAMQTFIHQTDYKHGLPTITIDYGLEDSLNTYTQTVFEQDVQNRLYRTQTYNAQQQLSNEVIYTYRHQTGEDLLKEVSRIYVNEKQVAAYITHYFYNKQEQLAEVIVKEQAATSVDERITFIYDQEGNLVRKMSCMGS